MEWADLAIKYWNIECQCHEILLLHKEFLCLTLHLSLPRYCGLTPASQLSTIQLLTHSPVLAEWRKNWKGKIEEETCELILNTKKRKKKGKGGEEKGKQTNKQTTHKEENKTKERQKQVMQMKIIVHHQLTDTQPVPKQ